MKQKTLPDLCKSMSPMSHHMPGSLLSLLKGIGACVLLGFLFYRHILGCCLLSPLIPIFVYKDRKKKQALVNGEETGQWKDLLTCFGTAMEAGFCAETAFREAATDLSMLYGNSCTMVKRIRQMCREVENGNSLENCLREFAQASKIPDTMQFAELFATAKRTGGDLLRTARAQANMIEQKEQLQREIATILTAKRLEARIMKLMPAGILLYLGIGMPGYLDPLYTGIFGRIVMTGILMLYLVCWYLCDKLVEIRMS